MSNLDIGILGTVVALVLIALRVPIGLSLGLVSIVGISQMFNMNVAWEFFAPVRIGDRLSSETVLADVFEKSIRLDPKAVWVVTERRIYNQNDELVATNTNTLLTHRRPDVVAAEAEGN